MAEKKHGMDDKYVDQNKPGNCNVQNMEGIRQHLMFPFLAEVKKFVTNKNSSPTPYDMLVKCLASVVLTLVLLDRDIYGFKHILSQIICH